MNYFLGILALIFLYVVLPLAGFWLFLKALGLIVRTIRKAWYE